MAKARYRPRKEIKMWLYRDKDEESRLIEFVQYCKQTRQLARMVRNGIRLMWSLGEGNTEVLYELFPWLQQKHAPEIGNLEQQLADLKRVLLEQGSFAISNQPIIKPVPKPPQLEAQTALIADAGAIVDNFLAFIQ